jgi:hypothetical protein
LKSRIHLRTDFESALVTTAEAVPSKRLTLAGQARARVVRRNAVKRQATAVRKQEGEAALCARSLQVMVGEEVEAILEVEEVEANEEVEEVEAATEGARRKAAQRYRTQQHRKRKRDAAETAAREEAARTTASTSASIATTDAGSVESAAAGPNQKVFSERTCRRWFLKYKTGLATMSESQIHGLVAQAVKLPAIQRSLAALGFTAPRESVALRAEAALTKSALHK